jgi:hypothetical protein
MVTAALSQQTAGGIIGAASLIVGFLALAVVGWIFWRAAKRDRQAGR